MQNKIWEKIQHLKAGDILVLEQLPRTKKEEEKLKMPSIYTTFKIRGRKEAVKKKATG